jgi:hypothetical protein
MDFQLIIIDQFQPSLLPHVRNQRQTGPAVLLSDLIPPPMRQPWSRGESFRPNSYTATSAY